MTISTAPKMVYFARRADGTGPIKIGCSLNVPSRMFMLSCSLRVQLVALASVEGGHALEARLHRYFEASAVCQEWFEPSPRLMALIDATSAGCFVEPHGPSKPNKFKEAARQNAIRSTAMDGIPWPYKTKEHHEMWLADRRRLEVTAYERVKRRTAELRAILTSSPRPGNSAGSTSPAVADVAAGDFSGAE